MADKPAPPIAGPRLRAGHLALAAVWAAALLPPMLWLAHASDPALAVRVLQGVRGAATTAAVVLGVLGAILLALYPPFPAWLRLLLHRVRLSLASDRGPLLRAIGELKNFESAHRHLEVGRLALQLGDLDTAEPHLLRARELEPTLAAAHHQIGLLALRIGDLPVAFDAFTRAESFDPGHAFGDAMLLGGRCLHLMGDHRNAASVLREHTRRHGGSRRSSYWLGEALLGIGDRAGAADAFATAAAPPTQKLTAEENWFRARARMRRWRGGA